MQKKLYGAIRTIGESTTDRCIEQVKKLGFNYCVIRDYKPLENASKETIRKAGTLKDRYDWVMTIDADEILDKMTLKKLENYCDKMKKEYDDKLFCFTGYVDCTKRGVIDSIHFFRTRYCEDIYNNIKDKNIGEREGKEESDICNWVVSNMNLKWAIGKWKVPMATHIFEAQISEKKEHNL